MYSPSAIAAAAQARRAQERALRDAAQAQKDQLRRAARPHEAGVDSWVVVPPDAGPLIDDGVQYGGPEAPNPWLDARDGESHRVRRDEPGWRVLGTRPRLT